MKKMLAINAKYRYNCCISTADDAFASIRVLVEETERMFYYGVLQKMRSRDRR